MHHTETTDGITQAAIGINTDGIQDLLAENALPVGILFIGILVVFGAKKKDWASSVTMVGIVLLGLGVVGLSSVGGDVGKAILDLVTTGA